MFYRATYPDDVDVSVSYVAPLNRSVEDGRHEKFLSKKVGTKAERKVIKNAMQQLMKRKAELMDDFEAYCQKYQYRFYIPTEDIYDYCVLEYPFALWQWGTPVDEIPDMEADDYVDGTLHEDSLARLLRLPQQVHGLRRAGIERTWLLRL